jgi:hypothetical protein
MRECVSLLIEIGAILIIVIETKKNNYGMATFPIETGSLEGGMSVEHPDRAAQEQKALRLLTDAEKV